MLQSLPGGELVFMNPLGRFLIFFKCHTHTLRLHWLPSHTIPCVLPYPYPDTDLLENRGLDLSLHKQGSDSLN